MKTNCKRIISILISVILILSILSVPAIADSEDAEWRIGQPELGTNTILYRSIDVNANATFYLYNITGEASWYSANSSAAIVENTFLDENSHSNAVIKGVAEGTTYIYNNITYNYPNGVGVVVSVSTPLSGNVTGKTLVETNAYPSVGSDIVRAVLPDDKILNIEATCGDYYRVSADDLTVDQLAGEYFVKKEDISVNSTALLFDDSTIFTTVGETEKLNVTVLPSVANANIVWTTSHPDVATVDNNGKITAIGAGIANIGAIDISNGVQTYATVYVYDDISHLTISSVPDQKYIKDEIRPSLTITDDVGQLVEGEDYTLSYENNVSVGQASIHIQFRDFFVGDTVVNFNIVEHDVNDAFTIENIDYTYEYAYNPVYSQPVVFCGSKMLVENEDYQVWHENNMDVGTAVVTINGLNGFTGSVVKTFQIVPLNVSDLDTNHSIDVQMQDKTYDGTARTSPPTIYIDDILVYMDNYTVEYSNNIKVGIATAKITFVGNYSGTITRYYNILPPKASLTTDIITAAICEDEFCETYSDRVYLSLTGCGINNVASGRATAFEIERDGVIVGVSSAGSSTYVDYDVIPSKTYTYRARQFFVDSDGIWHYGRWSDSCIGTTAPEIIEITNVQRSNDENSIQLSIDGALGTQNGNTIKYNVERITTRYGIADPDWITVGTAVTASTFTDTTAQAGMVYRYRVLPYFEKSVTVNDETITVKVIGEYSDVAVMANDLQTPTGLVTNFDIKSGQATLSWNSVTGATTYGIVYIRGSASSSPENIVYTQNNECTVTLTDLIPETNYYFKVYAVNDISGVYSEPSNYVNVYSSLGELTITDVEAKTTSAIFTFSGTTRNNTNIKVYLSTDGVNFIEALESKPGKSLIYDKLVPNTLYYVKACLVLITAELDIYISEYCNTICFKTYPEGPSISDYVKTATGVRIHFCEVEDTTSYSLSYWCDSAFVDELTCDGNKTYFDVPTSKNHEYEFRITAHREDGDIKGSRANYYTHERNKFYGFGATDATSDNGKYDFYDYIVDAFNSRGRYSNLDFSNYITNVGVSQLVTVENEKVGDFWNKMYTDCKIACLIAHGTPSTIQINGNNIYTCLETSRILSLPNGSFEGIEMLVLISCSTNGESDEYETSIANAFSNKGVQTVVCFSEVVTTPFVVDFSMHFIDYYGKHHGEANILENAKNYAYQKTIVMAEEYLENLDMDKDGKNDEYTTAEVVSKLKSYGLYSLSIL